MVNYIKVENQNSSATKSIAKVRTPIEMFGDEMLGDKFYKHVAIPYFKLVYKDLVA